MTAGPVPVEAGSRRYGVHVGRGVLDTVGDVATSATRARRALVVSQPPVADRYADRVEASLRAAGLEVTRHVFDDGEASKTVASLKGVWTAAAAVPLERRDVVVALGGGVVGDLAGFAAATYNRGIDVVQVPTTLLAQVDAAVGGKTGIDLAEGKNLVGAFHQPAAVVADVDTLATLPARTRVEGLGEVVKYGLIREPSILDDCEAHADAVATGQPERLADLVHRSVRVKAAVVAADERESGERAHLNLGHTYAHALEALTGYEAFLHGEAVAVGMLVALRLGERLGLHGPELHDRTRALLRRLGLPTTAPRLDPDDVLAVMARDKKADAGIRYVVLEALGRPAVVRPDPDDVLAAIDAVVGHDG
jgi:3-dehydroquinate synthase